MASPTLFEVLAAAVGAVPGGTERKGQQQMVEAIERAVEAREHLLIQAGTGTGKSLGYLVPALHSRKRTVVSTATLALQAQLIDEDLPRLVKSVKGPLGRTPTFAVLKGRQHYLCLARLKGTEDEEPADSLFAEDSGPKWVGAGSRLEKQRARIAEWAEETHTGDRSELDPGVDERVWRSVSTSARECVGASRCPFGDDCFAEQSRAVARQSDIVITNHSLLAVDMANGRHILPEHELLVIDEAHELTDRVTGAAQREMSADMVERAGGRAGPHTNNKVKAKISEAAETLRFAMDGMEPARLRSLPDSLVQALILVGAACRDGARTIGDANKGPGGKKAKKADGDAGPNPAAHLAKAGLEVLAETADRVIGESPEDVRWISVDDRGKQTLVVAPLSVADMVGESLFHKRTVVAASATLTLGGDFEVVRRSLGLPPAEELTDTNAGGQKPADPDTAAESDEDGKLTPEEIAAARKARLDKKNLPKPAKSTAKSGDSEDEEDEGPPRWRGLDVGSPFDYPRQGILYVAARLPRPTTSGLSEAAADEMVALTEAAGGRMLGLFSSRRAATNAAEALRERTDLPVLLQGEEALPLLVRRFKEERESCLLGVLSLWQGVDVPGPSCQLVVIDRLPFPRPDDPLTSARSQAADSAGASGFASVSVPIAAIRLAQGVGRLVRTATDRGVVAVLDSRLHNQRYGTFLRNSLPPFWYTTNLETARGALHRLTADPTSTKDS